MLAISPQDVDSHEKWAEQEGFKFALLADVDQKVIGEYGLTAPVVGLRRSVFVIDASGVLRWKHVTLVGLTYPAASTISAQLAALTPTG